MLLAPHIKLQIDTLWQPQHWPQHSHCVDIMSCCAAQEWQQMPLHNTASRSCPSGGQWKTAVIHVPGGQGHAQLEFVIKNNAGQVHTYTQCNACQLANFFQSFLLLLVALMSTCWSTFSCKSCSSACNFSCVSCVSLILQS